ncbi:MAG: AAA family ATPase [Alphaproteobacteria bacterium]|nr:AAA family ATPase [Alphaproteobacteria bacterium]
MKLIAINLERYRPFMAPLRLEIRPMTILIGKNSSGKSMLARLPSLLARAVSDEAESPLDLQFDEMDFGGSYNDLIHGRTPHGHLILGIEAEDDAGNIASFKARLQHFREREELAVTEFEYMYNNGSVIRLKSSLDTIWTPAPIYIDDNNNVGSVNFVGIYPRNIDQTFGKTNINMALQGLALFQSVLSKPTYLGPFRDLPRRSYPMAPQTLRSLGPRGERAGAFMADDQFRRGAFIAGEIGTWFETHMGGQRIEARRDGTGYALVVQDAMRELAEVGLLDTGTGLAQILPLVALRFGVAAQRLSTSLVTMEQPELHLHPAAHGNVCDLFLELARSGTPCLVETHSEAFIMRLRRRIAAGEFPYQDVILHSVDHNDPRENNSPYVKSIEFSSEGTPATWPKGVFEETYQDVLEIRKAIRERR